MTSHPTSRHQPLRLPRLPFYLISALTLLLFCQPAYGIKFALSAYRFPPAKCVWNAAHPGDLVIVTANVSPGEGQRIDIEIVDSNQRRNVYLNKKGINGEKRFAITAHAEEDVGVCFRNYLDPSQFAVSRAVDCVHVAEARFYLRHYG